MIFLGVGPASAACGSARETAHLFGLNRIPAGFAISRSTAHVYTTAVTDLFAERAPALLKVLREADPDFVLLAAHSQNATASAMGGPTTRTSTVGTG